ncbi:hypothetical protein [Peloplasma aerotolerans]|uniref:Uncharacterized protein n=1 Tax=Peloplasma aerotolerans TaxID=3044389 RepID=A0AAW6U8U3_9MOLU|nr:hypothetical protein [Mariniplasma sp. M4Ah]MDI6452471.1 hypothetical protein [Mariniplasma sp. M4Ah]
MRKYLISIITITLLIASIATVTYAWFTYVEKKSLATFEAGEISITAAANDQLLVDNILLEDLAFIDYQKDLIDDTTGHFDLMASTLTITIQNSDRSVLTRNKIVLTEEGTIDGLLYFLVLDGVNIGGTENISTNYQSMILSVISSYATKEEQLLAIMDHNTLVLDDIYNTVIGASDVLTFQIIFWGDYDELTDPESYLDMIYSFSIFIDTINSKGEVV